MKRYSTNKLWLILAFISLILTVSCEKQPEEEPEPNITVTLNQSSLTLQKGESASVQVSVEPSEYASEVKWLVGDNSIVSFDNGTVTGIKVGKTSLWAFVRESKASCSIEVVAVDPQSITISETSLSLKLNDTFQLSASLDPSNAEGEIYWKSSNQSIVSVSETGLLTCLSYGKATITARCGLLTAQCIVTIEPDAPKVGDYFYSDGTWSDGGLVSIDEYGMNAVWASPKPAPIEGKTVIGIVFQTNENRIYSADAAAGYTHGYVVSTHIAHYPADNETRYSFDEGIECLDNCKLGTSWYANLKGSWETSQVYNTYAQGKGTEYVPAFKLVKEDFDPAPDNTSGWFLPSTGQLWDMVANFCGDEIATMLKEYRTISYDITYERGTTPSYSVIDKFNEMAALVPDSMKEDLYVPAAEAYHNYCGIWTSTLYDNSDGAACLFYLGNAKGKTMASCDWVDNPYFVKPILAF